MKLKKIMIPLLTALSALSVGLSAFVRQPVSQTPTNTSSAPLEIHFIDVGQGDSTLIRCGDATMLIDAGENDQGTNVQSYLSAQGVDHLDYMIGTHPDSDHIGGMDVILYKFDCDTVIMPDEVKNTATYRDVIDTMENKRYSNTLPVVGDTYSLGEATFTILAPSRIHENSNDNSVAILLTHGENRFLFTADAQETAEKEILDTGISIQADVYKAGHHGSSTSSSEAFLEAVAPTYAVISCGENNDYGHPHAEVLNSLRSMGVQVFRTDEQGSIIAYSDGQNITWNCSPSESWLSGSGAHVGDTSGTANTGSASADSGSQNDSGSQKLTYVCNTNTMKFHYPDCSSATDMKKENKLEITATRDELLKQGYVPCGGCKP